MRSMTAQWLYPSWTGESSSDTSRFPAGWTRISRMYPLRAYQRKRPLVSLSQKRLCVKSRPLSSTWQLHLVLPSVFLDRTQNFSSWFYSLLQGWVVAMKVSPMSERKNNRQRCRQWLKGRYMLIRKPGGNIQISFHKGGSGLRKVVSVYKCWTSISIILSGNQRISRAGSQEPNVMEVFIGKYLNSAVQVAQER